jgi:hypothetical protein
MEAVAASASTMVMAHREKKPVAPLSRGFFQSPKNKKELS